MKKILEPEYEVTVVIGEGIGEDKNYISVENAEDYNDESCFWFEINKLQSRYDELIGAKNKPEARG